MAILAAVVIPQVSEAVENAKESAMLADLHQLTTAIERYKIQHDGLPPDDMNNNTLSQLTQKTDAYGTYDPGGEYGPYVLNEIPPNPLNGDQRIYRTSTVPPKLLQRRTGWIYYPETGQIWAGEGPPALLKAAAAKSIP